MAVDQGTYPTPTNPALTGTADTGTAPVTPSTPAMMALPVAPLAPDASTSRKFYTLTASLREIYDDNVNTSHTDPVTSYETQLSPSVLVDFPSGDSDFSARYTFDLTYYSAGTESSSNNKKSSVDYTHEFVAQYQHAFSTRFNFNASEQFRYYTEPSIFESTGTLYRNGGYISNILNGSLSAQWTPLLGSITSYSNTVVRYDEADVALVQNNIENTGTHNFIYTLAPKIGLSFGGIVDEVSYDGDSRGYSNYTAFTGIEWKALPSLNATALGGGSYTELPQTSGVASPYASLSVDWSLGARSELTFHYAHEVTPTDQSEADAQTADRFTANFKYDITPSLSAHLQGIFTKSNIAASFITNSSLKSYDENDYGIDTGLTYHYTSYLSFDLGLVVTGVSSGMESLSYARDEASVGVRGTY